MTASPLVLPDFPWDRLVPFREIAELVPGGICDLSVGTPVDSVPPLIRAALAQASDSPGYPTTLGTAGLRESIAGWLQRRLGVVPDAKAIVPAIGSKELIAMLPSFLGLAAGSQVVIPETAYPTYEVSALLAGATP
ncbi:MAG: aminotransferase class I/II-fold pyridoxal phosphate-dependent enzyme, partial [Actinobacteria bacterium]|nr:aminotransferase class I/II-fold pyridoxal phosphate-dependent enzyme [Actinomycetota bacterium]